MEPESYLLCSGEEKTRNVAQDTIRRYNKKEGKLVTLSLSLSEVSFPHTAQTHSFQPYRHTHTAASM